MERKGSNLTVYANCSPILAAEFPKCFFINSEGKALTSGFMKIEFHDWGLVAVEGGVCPRRRC